MKDTYEDLCERIDLLCERKNCLEEEIYDISEELVHLLMLRREFNKETKDLNDD